MVPATVVGMSRRITSATILVAVTALLAGCVPVFGADPRFATNSGARPQGVADPKPPPGGPAPIAAPKNDLSWRDCTSKRHRRRGSPRRAGGQAGVRQLRRRPRPGQRRIRLGEHRRGPRPLGQDSQGRRAARLHHRLRHPSSTQLPVWLSRAGADVLHSHPIVAIDRRGMGMSSPIDCRDRHRPRGDARPVSVPDRRRPGGQPLRSLQHRHHQLHATPSRPATPPTTTPTPLPTSSGCATSGMCRRSRWSASATAPRWR